MSLTIKEEIFVQRRIEGYSQTEAYRFAYNCENMKDKTVIEKEGQWPTNYLNKAMELGLFEGISYSAVADDVDKVDGARLIWNMLNTKMWQVISEGEGGGLTSGESEKTMLEIKFPDANI